MLMRFVARLRKSVALAFRVVAPTTPVVVEEWAAEEKPFYQWGLEGRKALPDFTMEPAVYVEGLQNRKHRVPAVETPAPVWVTGFEKGAAGFQKLCAKFEADKAKAKPVDYKAEAVARWAREDRALTQDAIDDRLEAELVKRHKWVTRQNMLTEAIEAGAYDGDDEVWVYRPEWVLKQNQALRTVQRIEAVEQAPGRKARREEWLKRANAARRASEPAKLARRAAAAKERRAHFH